MNLHGAMIPIMYCTISCVVVAPEHPVTCTASTKGCEESTGQTGECFILLEGGFQR